MPEVPPPAVLMDAGEMTEVSEAVDPGRDTPPAPAPAGCRPLMSNCRNMFMAFCWSVGPAGSPCLLGGCGRRFGLGLVVGFVDVGRRPAAPPWLYVGRLS